MSLPDLPPPGHPGARLRAMLASGRIVVAPGVFNGISALLAREAGFEAGYFSGGALANTMGIADIGLFGLADLSSEVRKITSLVEMPLIVDIDTGFGGPINARRTAAEMARSGVAAVHIEDQVTTKRCGHLDGKELIPVADMQTKVAAAREAAGDMLVIARTDARTVEGFDGAVLRAERYVEAGADLVFPEALLTRDEFAAFRDRIRVPLLANMTEFGKTPFMTASDFEALGYDIVIFPQSVFRLALGAIRDGYRELRETGSQEGFVPRMLSRSEIYQTIGYDVTLAQDAALARHFATDDTERQDAAHV